MQSNAKYFHLERPVVKSVVETFLEEISVSVGVLDCVVDIVRYSLPVGDWSGIRTTDGRTFLRIKLPIVASLEKVDLPVA